MCVMCQGTFAVSEAMLCRMPLPSPPSNLLDDAALFLDLDGTLVEFALSPAGITVCDELRGLLRDLSHRLDGRLAVISGRALDDLAGHLGLPQLAIAGSHGSERRGADGRIEACEIPASVSEATQDAAAFVADRPLLLESKPTGVAIHFRNSPELEAEVDQFAIDLAQRHGLIVQNGAMVRELRSPGRNKGDVVRLYMSEEPFCRGRPVMIGDDVTDEDAFAVVNELEGSSILVGPERATLAQFRLPDVASVKHWLAEGL